ncbi:hypothetical protein [Streptomyces sp. NPDC046712]|uniref:hypothetical protein n=1 Tax=Streptomyces sp. NPDC046712 TaxID=3154802 RepID=UPI0033E701E6
MTIDSTRDGDARVGCDGRDEGDARDGRDARDGWAARGDGTLAAPPGSAVARLPRALAHRWPTLLALALAVVTFVDGLPGRELLAGLLVLMPLCYLAFGALRGELRPAGALVRQLAGLLGFAAVALIALAVDETLGLRLLAAGWLAHAVWDLVHHRTGKVVPRAWSEWCCVVDASGALAMAVLA